jgi:hypothetical protein
MLPDNPRRRIRYILRTFLFVMCGLLLAAGLLLLVVPALDGPHSRQLAHESVAVSKVRTVVTLQDQYRAAHAYNGFACELSQLIPPDQRSEAEYDPLRFLTTGTYAGYKFSLMNCGSDANRARVHYQITAVPIDYGTTGFRAFCADESGLIWYDKSGSATNCVNSQRVLE